MLKNLYLLLKYGHRIQRVNLALARGAAASALREINPARPNTWEFAAFSQNGEDGIIDFLLGKLTAPTRYFIEVGASDGLENNSSWLAIGRRFAGLMVEGDARKSKRCKRLLSVINAGVKNLRMFVTKDNVEEIRRAAATPNPDLFSLDIDGNDYYVAEAVMASGFRPAVFAVEYNSAYGPIKSLSIKYQENFDYSRAHPSRLYYGVSITGWRRFFQRHGYRFVTVDLNGTNAFFADPAAFSPGFLQALQGLDYAENRHQTVRFQCSWEEQFPRIEHLEYEEIE